MKCLEDYTEISSQNIPPENWRKKLNNYTFLASITLSLFTGNSKEAILYATALYTNLSIMKYHAEDIETAISQNYIVRSHLYMLFISPIYAEMPERSNGSGLGPDSLVLS